MHKIFELLQEHKAGYLGAFISFETRSEQGLPPLDPAVAQEAMRILENPTDGARVRQAIEEVGPMRTLDVLEAVLHRRKRPQGFLVFSASLAYDQHIGSCTWLLENCDVGITGVTVRVRMWGGVTVTAPEPHGPDGYAAWDGWLNVTDEHGLALQPASISTQMTPIQVLSAGRQTSSRWMIVHTQSFYPGLPIAARQLHLRAAADVKLRRFDVSTHEWAWWPVTLRDTDFVVDLDRRIAHNERRRAATD